MTVRRMARAVILLALVGCGGGRDPNLPELVPVRGTVTWNGQPLAGASVTFTPTGDTRGTGATGRTDAAGRYTLTPHHGGGTGTAVGTYKVTINKLVLKDGSDYVPDPNVPPIEAPAREMLPASYSDPDRTTLTAKVPAGGGTMDFPLQAVKK